MSPWTLLDSSSADNEVYSRPLGCTEIGFYWDGYFAGTGDTLQHVQVSVKSALHRDLFLLSNLKRTWTQLKCRYPLLGCTVEQRGDEENVDFKVEERNLRLSRPDEINIVAINSLQEAEDFIDIAINGPRQLSSHLLSRVWVLPRSDQSDQFHVLVHVAHLITDGIANALILRDFFDLLCTPSEEVLPRLGQRLRLIVPLEDLFPITRLSMPQRRWRRAIASVLFAIKESKLQGGHTLPRNLNAQSWATPAHSRLTTLALPPDVSSRIILSCRKAKITFGHAFPVISQLAHSRVLHRLRLRGLLSEEEWQERTQQPMNFLGPLNLRPYVCPEWCETWGAGKVSVLCTSSSNTLPFMPTSKLRPDKWVDGAPPFYSLLSKERFLLRCRIIKKQTTDYMRNPLFLELSELWNASRTAGVKEVADEWRGLQQRSDGPGYMKNICSEIRPTATHLTLSNSGSSMGNFDAIFPSEYPRHSSDSKVSQEPIIHATLSTNRLHCRPMELYLGSYMSSRRMHLLVYWDGNVYDEHLVKLWLEEVRKATMWYLGNEEISGDYSEIEKSRL